MAFIVLKQDIKLAPKDVITFLEDKIAYFSIPRYIEFIDEMPQTENGKIKKYALRERGVAEETWDREREN